MLVSHLFADSDFPDYLNPGIEKARLALKKAKEVIEIFEKGE